MPWIRDFDEAKAVQAFENHFGTCPHCHKTDGFINIGSVHVFLCREHKLKWCVGSNLFSCWRHQTEDEQRQIYDRLGVGDFTEIQPDECFHPSDPYDGDIGPAIGRRADHTN
jgi:hypothetical protein